MEYAFQVIWLAIRHSMRAAKCSGHWHITFRVTISPHATPATNKTELSCELGSEGARKAHPALSLPLRHVLDLLDTVQLHVSL
jgi:hypothetical protein